MHCRHPSRGWGSNRFLRGSKARNASSDNDLHVDGRSRGLSSAPLSPSNDKNNFSKYLLTTRKFAGKRFNASASHDATWCHRHGFRFTNNVWCRAFRIHIGWSILWSHNEETRELPGERDNARNNARCTKARKATYGLDGQHQDVDRTLRERVNQNDRGQG